MQPERIREPNPDAEDEAHDRAVQRELDDETALRMQSAFADGVETRQRGGAPSLNPHGLYTPEREEWLRGWRSADARILAADLRRRAAMRQRCTDCLCGGKGLCRDAA